MIQLPKVVQRKRSCEVGFPVYVCTVDYYKNHCMDRYLSLLMATYTRNGDGPDPDGPVMFQL